MPSNQVYDLVNNLLAGQSIAPAASAAATVNGSGIDMTNSEGPATIEVNVGAATGSPSSFSVTATMQESVDNSNWTNTTTQTTLVMTAAGVGYLRGNREAKYVRSSVVIAFVGGTSPTLVVGSNVMAQKRNF